MVINELHEEESRWFAIYTKYKCEKFVAEHLERKDIESYVPIIKKTKHYASRKKEFEVPLINCYVFVKIVKKDFVPVLETEYVMKFLKIGKDLIAIPEEEINLLKRIVGELDVPVSLSERNFKVGQKVEVIGGHLTGIHGVLVEEKNNHSFVVELQNIGIALQVDVDRNLLRPIH